MADRPLQLFADQSAEEVNRTEEGGAAMTDYKWIEPWLRLLIAALFLVSATTKVTESAGIQAYMRAFGVPPILVWPAAALEYAASLLVLVGLWVGPVSVLLAGWCVLTAIIFHMNFSDLDQLMNFFKNITMAGGFLMLAKSGSLAGSVDAVIAARGEAIH
jgi:putative oxidoreductase